MELEMGTTANAQTRTLSSGIDLREQRKTTRFGAHFSSWFLSARLVNMRRKRVDAKFTSLRATFYLSDNLQCFAKYEMVCTSMRRLGMDRWEQRGASESSKSKWTCCNYSSSERKSFPFCVWLKRHFLPISRHFGVRFSFASCIWAEKTFNERRQKFCIRDRDSFRGDNDDKNGDDDDEGGNTSSCLRAKIIRYPRDVALQPLRLDLIGDIFVWLLLHILFSRCLCKSHKIFSIFIATRAHLFRHHSNANEIPLAFALWNSICEF